MHTCRISEKNPEKKFPEKTTGARPRVFHQKRDNVFVRGSLRSCIWSVETQLNWYDISLRFVLLSVQID